MLVHAFLPVLLAAAPLRVAVLPFANETNEVAYEVLRRGLADMVTTDLVGVDGLQVVERERLDAVLSELTLQQSKAFDVSTAQRVGKLLGASHEVVGAITAVAPKVRLDLRLVAVATGANVVKATVLGSPDDLFSLETELVAKLLHALALKVTERGASHASLAAYVSYSSALAAVDSGALDDAKSKLAEVVRGSPDFDLAKQRYAEVLKRLREAQKKRGESFDEAERALEARFDALLSQAGVELNARLGARIAKSNLALVRLRRAAGVRSADATWVPPSKRDAVERLEQQWLENGARLIDELTAVRGKRVDPALPDEDAERSKTALGLDLGEWNWVTPTSVAIDLGTYLGSGRSPHTSDVEEFALRPTRVQRRATELAAATRWFELAAKSLPLDYPSGERARPAMRLANEHAEVFVLLARREEAVAQLQGFLDAYPTSEDFPALSAKVEGLMLLSDEAERAEALLKACDATLDVKAAANRTWRALGRKGLVALGEALRGCAKKNPLGASSAWVVVAREAARVGDCEAVLDFAARAKRDGATPVPMAPCDSP